MVKVSALVKFAYEYPEYYKFFKAIKKVASFVKMANVYNDIDIFIKEKLDKYNVEYEQKNNFGNVIQSVIKRYIKDSYLIDDMEGFIFLKIFKDDKEIDNLILNSYRSSKGSFFNFFYTYIKHLVLNQLNSVDFRKKRNDFVLVKNYTNEEDFESFADKIQSKELQYINNTALDLDYDDLIEDFRAYTKTLRPSRFDPRIMDMLDYIIDHFDSSVNERLLGYEIAEYFNVTPQTISRWSNKLKEVIKDFAKYRKLEGLEKMIEIYV